MYGLVVGVQRLSQEVALALKERQRNRSFVLGKIHETDQEVLERSRAVLSVRSNEKLKVGCRGWTKTPCMVKVGVSGARGPMRLIRRTTRHLFAQIVGRRAPIRFLGVADLSWAHAKKKKTIAGRRHHQAARGFRDVDHGGTGKRNTQAELHAERVQGGGKGKTCSASKAPL